MNGLLPVDAERHDRVVRDAGEANVERAVQDERNERGRSGNQGVTEGFGQRVPAAVAPGLRQREPAGRENDVSRDPRPGGGVDVEGIRFTLDAQDAMAGEEPGSAAFRLGYEGVQNRARFVRIGKELPARLRVERDADVPKEGRRRARRKCRQDASDDVTRPSLKVRGIHDAVGDVAASAPTDQDLRPQRLGAVERDDRGVRPMARGEDGRGETCGPGPNDGHVDAVGHGAGRKLTL